MSVTLIISAQSLLCIITAMTPFQTMNIHPTQKHHVLCRIFVPSLVWSTGLHKTFMSVFTKADGNKVQGCTGLLSVDIQLCWYLTVLHQVGIFRLSTPQVPSTFLHDMLYGSRTQCPCLALDQWGDLFLQIYHLFQAQYWLYCQFLISNKLQILEGFLRNFQRYWWPVIS